MFKTYDCTFDLKEVSEGDRTFTGYGSVFGEVDQGRDIVARGAFTESLNEQKNKGRMPKMLYYHDPRRPIGVWEEMREDEVGLFCKGRFTKGVRDADEVYALLQDKAIEGLSIGYRTLDYDYDEDLQIRKLTKLHLGEVSVVTFPMLESANVIDVKELEFNPRKVESEFRAAGLSSSDAVKAVAVMKQYLGRDVPGPQQAPSRDDGNAMKELLAALRDGRHSTFS